MARASFSFQPQTKALERMKNDSQLNRAHGNGAGPRRSEEKNLFHTADQRSGKGLQQELREGHGWKKKIAAGVGRNVRKGANQIRVSSVG